MPRRMPALIVFAASLLARTAEAQERTWATLREDAENFFGDVYHVWTSPVRADGSDVAGVAALGGVLLGVGLFDDEIQDWLREHPNALPVRALAPLRDSEPLSKLGYTFALIALSGGLYAAGHVFDSDGVREAGIGCLTSDLANTFARHALARLLGRLRPQYTRDPYVIRVLAFGAWPMRSFPGGHAANIMACSTFWNRRFDLGIAEPALYAFSAAIGMARVVDQAHWTTDTIFGLVFGWAVGRAVAGRFAERDDASVGTAAVAAAHRPPLLTIGWRIRF